MADLRYQAKGANRTPLDRLVPRPEGGGASGPSAAGSLSTPRGVVARRLFCADGLTKGLNSDHNIG